MHALVAVSKDRNEYAGMATVYNDQETWSAGGWLAPTYSQHGLGHELFEAACLLAHGYLGICTLQAGAENRNIASQRALAAAGFLPTHGPRQHTRCPTAES
ncbi:GNAT family N-acetyltransferase [Candidatus Protofrankia californiensis]|uniref:GNAT family N-acetyltransferase n=1 Tax=Candidatus Protofrankia californiensis TaxID=1839754 RepID=UPI0010411637|nr:GNAT family N-acetyltransferase [Candidatus Protofrankia californiensis]